MRAYERFLRYVAVDSQSDHRVDKVPSTEKQKDMGRLLVEEMRQIGIADAEMDDRCYVYGSIPGSPGCEDKPALGLIAHMDTTPDLSGTGVKARIVEKYDGGDIVLNEELGIVTDVESYPLLKTYTGDDIIVTDGTTLLGADDKAGIAEIMALAEEVLADPSIPHPPLRLAFTPDEEIGYAPLHFNMERHNAAYAYTLDGGSIGELQYESFNAATAVIRINGITAHPGTAKGVMRNASLVAMEFHQMLPIFENPASTQGREGFFHLESMEGNCAGAWLRYYVRDHDRGIFEGRKALLQSAAGYINAKYGAGTAVVELEDSYYNMEEIIRDHMHLIDNAAQAMRNLGIEPVSKPIRGGTDGCSFSFSGLPCPNLCTGGMFAHSRHECISVQAMDKVVDILRELVKIYASQQ